MGVARSVQIGPPPSSNRAATPSDSLGITDSLSAVFSSGITHGRQVNATNTGIAGKGLVQADLTAMSGGTLSTSGGYYYRRVITSTLNITGNNNVFEQCLFIPSGAASGHAIWCHGTGSEFNDCTVTTSSGSLENCIRIEGEASGTKIRRCDLSRCENLVGFMDENSGGLMEDSYLHDANNSTTGGHLDGMEVYGSLNLTLRRNRIMFDAAPTATINVAPWNGASSVDGLYIYDNFLDGGQNHLLIDLQGTGSIRNVQFLRNDCGGHTYVPDGRYSAVRVDAPNGICETLAQQTATPTLVWIPTTGPDVNHWAECSDLVPDKTGQIVIP